MYGGYTNPARNGGFFLTVRAYPCTAIVQNQLVQKKESNQSGRIPLILLVPGTRIELVHPYGRGILSLIQPLNINKLEPTKYNNNKEI